MRHKQIAGGNGEPGLLPVRHHLTDFLFSLVQWAFLCGLIWAVLGEHR